MDKLENGNYQVFLKKQDRFYFVDSKNPENNKIMLGKTVAKNLQNQSGSVPLYSNNTKIKLKQLFNEFDFLISKGLDFDTSFEAIGKELEQTYYQTESILENLDKKILEYVEENKAYARPNTRILKTLGTSSNQIQNNHSFYHKYCWSSLNVGHRHSLAQIFHSSGLVFGIKAWIHSLCIC